MLFRNTSAPSNPFSSENSLNTSIYNKGLRRTPDQHYSSYSNLSRKSPSKSYYQNDHWNTQHKTNINQIKQDNPFEKYSNLDALVRQGITEKHQYQRLRKQERSPFKTNYQYKNYQYQSNKHMFSQNQNGYYNYNDYSTSSSYIPSSYTPKNYQLNGKSDYGGSYYGSSSYIPPISTYTQSQQPVTYERVQPGPLLQKKVSKFKPISSNLNSSNNYSFDQQKNRSHDESISQYFPKQQQRMVQQSKINQLRGSQASQASHGTKQSKQLRGSVAFRNSQAFDPFNDQMQKNDSIMSHSSKIQNNSMFKNSLGKKDSIQSNNLRFSSADDRQTFGKAKPQQKMSVSDDPFDQFSKNNKNFAYQSFVQQQSVWPEFIELNNTKFYYKPLKSRNKSN